MTGEQITTAAELDALPAGSVVMFSGYTDPMWGYCDPTVAHRREDPYWEPPGDDDGLSEPNLVWQVAGGDPAGMGSSDFTTFPATLIYHPTRDLIREAEPAFDRWLAAHDREVAARALREAADEMDDTDDPDAIYVSNGDIDLWLRARADRTEKGETDG